MRGGRDDLRSPLATWRRSGSTWANSARWRPTTWLASSSCHEPLSTASGSRSKDRMALRAHPSDCLQSAVGVSPGCTHFGIRNSGAMMRRSAASHSARAWRDGSRPSHETMTGTGIERTASRIASSPFSNKRCVLASLAPHTSHTQCLVRTREGVSTSTARSSAESSSSRALRSACISTTRARSPSADARRVSAPKAAAICASAPCERTEPDAPSARH
mmetsp:Transcript_9667/g.27945  ORF Transcript_9667/g.27945 Transcript_9667/m.27945 type:complete len:218 (-) Transcript_9667:6873-7526(-)